MKEDGSVPLFYRKVKSLCTKKGVSLAEMARELKLGNSAPTYWKKDGRIPGGDTVQRIADYLGTKSDYLLSDKEDGSYQPSEPADVIGLSEDKNIYGYLPSAMRGSTKTIIFIETQKYADVEFLKNWVESNSPENISEDELKLKISNVIAVLEAIKDNYEKSIAEYSQDNEALKKVCTDYEKRLREKDTEIYKQNESYRLLLRAIEKISISNTEASKGLNIPDNNTK